jgi:tetratricopeptide (TPR) repeat protein
MTNENQLTSILSRITSKEYTDVDLKILRQFLNLQDSQVVNQIGKYNVNIAEGKDIQIGDRLFVEWNDDAMQALVKVIQQQLTPKPTGIPENLPRSGVVEFVGREQELELIYQYLHQSEQAVAVAVVGMGGVGKTELVLQYALKHKATYSGGICWLQGKEVNIAVQIIQFAQSCLELMPPEELELLAQVRWCWTHWSAGDVLIIIDNVNAQKYKEIQPYLPPSSDPRFKVLVTTRSRLGRSFKSISVDVLNEADALTLLEVLIGKERLFAELSTVKELCLWLGYLPLALELVGRYLDRKPDLSIAEMQQRLEKKRLEERSVKTPDSDMTAQLGVAAAFTISWETLPEDAKHLSCLLSLFAAEPIPWSLVEQCCPDREAEDLEELRDDHLVNLHLLKRKGEDTYQLHQLIRKFFREKHACLSQIDTLNRQFCWGMEAIAKEIPESPTKSTILQFSPAIPHIVEAITQLSTCFSDSDFIKPFQGLGRWYEGQGFYKQAKDWYEKCCEETKKRFGVENLNIAIGWNHLANAHRHLGHYEDAESWYLKALKIRERLLGNNHLDVAESLNDLALLYYEQGHYSQAEPLYEKALTIKTNLLGHKHSEVADSLNNLALLYIAEGRYSNAEPLCLQALSIRKEVLGLEHPRTATSLNNLAYCYTCEERYAEAELLYKEALTLTQRLLGEEHPDVAASLNNLGHLYVLLKRYADAEPLFIQALELHKQFFGDKHPDVATSLNNLAYLYDIQERYSEAEPRYSEALALRKQLLGENHLDVGISFNNLAKLYCAQNRCEEAELLYLQALDILEPQLGADHPITARVRSNLEQLRLSKSASSDAGVAIA